MKKLIRSSVFETNSSSSHSISIADDTKEFVLDTIYPDQNGKVVLTGGEFGWEWFKHNDALTKANYAAVDFKDNDDLKKVLIEVVKIQTGAEEVVLSFTPDYDGPNWSYIDHQSVGRTPRNKKDLRNFIFNKNSWLFGGNDNSQVSPTFYDVPEFKSGKQILPVYKYEVEIEGYKKKTQFKKKPTQEEIEKSIESILNGVRVHENGMFDDNNDIMSQILRNNSRLFEFNSWKKPIDHKSKVVFFVKDAWEEAKKIWDKEYGKNDWNSELGFSKCKEIEEGLYNKKQSPFVKKIKFKINKIDKLK